MPDEQDIFPKKRDSESKPKKAQPRSVEVKRYGRVINGKQICLSLDGKETFLVPVEKVKGKASFSLVIDGKVESVYNWRDDKFTGKMIDAAYLALLRLGKTEKTELSAEEVAYIARAIAATLNK